MKQIIVRLDFRSIGKIITCLLVCLAISGISSAQNSNSNVKGRIIDDNESSLEGITVTLNNKKTSSGSITDEYGYFIINNVPPGTYTITASAIGFKGSKTNIEVETGKPVTLNLKLSKSSNELQEVIVNAETSKNKRIVYTATKMPVAIKDIPFSIQVIDRKLMNEQQMNRLSEVARNSPGVYVWSTIGGVNENLGARGFSIGDKGTFRNGIRYNYEGMPDVQGLESVEILKGSSAIIFGQVSPGATVNLITKKPRFEKGGEVSMRLGSYQFYKPALDIYGTIGNSNHLAYRINTSYENSNSFRETVKAKRFYINPSLLWKIGSKTTWLFEGDYLNDDRTADYGVVAISETKTIDGKQYSVQSLVDLPRKRFLGAAFNNNVAAQTNFSYTLQHKFNDKLTLRHLVGITKTKKDLLSTGYHSTTIAVDGNFSRSVQRIDEDDNYRIAQIDLLGNFNTGKKIKHQTLVGIDADKRNNYNTSYNRFTAYDTINVYTMQAKAGSKLRSDVPELIKSNYATPEINRYGVYAQDLISIGGHFKILLGIRYSAVNNFSTTTTFKGNKIGTRILPQDTVITSTLKSTAFTPSAGLVYQPTKNISMYASYTSSFSPNSSLDKDGNVLKPSVIDQYEAGIKADLFKGILQANLSVYKIINNDVAVALATVPGRFELAGQQVNQGIEVGVTTKSFHGLSIATGYSYIDARYKKTTTYIPNSRPLNVPKHSGNAWINYKKQTGKLKELNLGIGLFIVGNRFGNDRFPTSATRIETVPYVLPSFTELDASIGYTIGKYSVQAKVTNITNAISYHVYRNLSINPTAPRQFATTVAMKL